MSTLRPGAWFVTGTDTGVGKTRVSGALLRAARELGATVAGMKPVAAGGIVHDGRKINEDAAYLALNSGQITPDELLNPYCLPDPISPHIAAKRAGIEIDIGHIVRCAETIARGHRLVLIEGAGGWYAPINERETMADMVRALNIPVLLVVGLRLGCLNHAVLTRRAIEREHCVLQGWIGSHVDPHFAASAENIATLVRLLRSEPMALLAYSHDTRTDAAALRAAAATLLARAG